MQPAACIPATLVLKVRIHKYEVAFQYGQSQCVHNHEYKIAHTMLTEKVVLTINIRM